jgi:hypothetical protein
LPGVWILRIVPVVGGVFVPPRSTVAVAPLPPGPTIVSVQDSDEVPVALVIPDTYVPLVTPPLPPMSGVSSPCMLTLRHGPEAQVAWAERLAAPPRLTNTTAINFTKKDDVLATLRSPLPFRQTGHPQ